MEDLKKIDLNSSPEEKSTETISNNKSFHLPKNLIIVLGVILVLAVLSFFTIILPLQRTVVSGKSTYTQAKKAYEALKKQNIELASVELAKTKVALADTQKSLNAFSYVKFIPFLNSYYSDAEHLTKAGLYGLDAASILVDSLKPYADVLGLKGQGSFVMGSAEQRIQTAVMTMGKITPKIDDVSKSVELAQKEIDAVDPNHYPSFFGGEKVKQQLIKLQEATDQGVYFVKEARPLIKVLPDLLGESKEKKYLVLFQNDKELRPTGGFITAYAVFRVDKGNIRVETSEDIYHLDNTIYGKEKAPRPILAYLPKVYTFNLRDSNLSPDYIESMKTFESLYNKASAKVKIDGIIALDTHVLSSTIKVLDDEIVASGIKFTTKNDKRCDCEQVIYELEDNISRPVGYLREDRKGLLGSLLYALMQKSLKASPKLYWGPLFQTLINEANEKHVLFYLHDKDAQSGVEAINLAGRIKSFDGDYLHINETNFAGGKANLYVKEAVTQEINVADDGSVTKTVTINYKNPYPPSDCNLERGGLCLNAVLRDWLRIYVPKGSILVDSTGSEVKMTSYEELGKTVFEGFISVKPEGAAKFTITYKLPFKLTKGSVFPLLIQKQPGTNNNEYTVKLNGRQVQKFELLTDKEFKLKP